MDEREFLVEARLLVAQPRESAWRSASSRAYYAAFHVAWRLLEGMGFAVPTSDRVHRYLSLRLANCGDATVQDAGNDLNALRGRRNFADYQLRRTHKQAAARADVNVAEQIIQTLDALTPGPMLISIRDEMIRYERDVLKDVTWVP